MYVQVGCGQRDVLTRKPIRAGPSPKAREAGERVVDLFAGVGQFSIPIAVHAKPGVIHAIELNPIAHGYLCENIRLNRVGHLVSPIKGDCEAVAPRGIADRVLLGILHVTHRYLSLALEVLKPEGGLSTTTRAYPSVSGSAVPSSESGRQRGNGGRNPGEARGEVRPGGGPRGGRCQNRPEVRLE